MDMRDIYNDNTDFFFYEIIQKSCMEGNKCGNVL